MQRPRQMTVATGEEAQGAAGLRAAGAGAALLPTTTTYMMAAEALLIAAVAVFAWFLSPAIGTAVGIALTLWALAHIVRTGYSPMLTLRLAALGLPGLSAAILQSVRPYGIVAIYFADFQTPEFTHKVILATVMGLAATLLAWAVAMRPRRRRRPAVAAAPHFGALYGLLLLAALVFFALDLQGRGSVIWRQAYGYGSVGETFLGLNVYGSVALSLVVALTALALSHPHATSLARWCTFVVVVAVIVVGYLPRGERSEIISFLSAFYVMYVVTSGRPVRALGLIVAFFGVSLFALAQAAVRTYLAANISPLEAVAGGLQVFSWEIRGFGDSFAYAYGVYDLPVFGMSFLLYGVIGLTQAGVLEFRYGGTILDHLLNTLPAAINPFRSDSISWLFSSLGYASGGGFLELAEGYLNGGLAGVFALCFAVSYAYFMVFRRAAGRRDPYSTIWLGVFAALTVRATLYGVNDLYKGVLAFALVFLVIRFAARLLAPRPAMPRGDGAPTARADHVEPSG